MKIRRRGTATPPPYGPLLLGFLIIVLERNRNRVAPPCEKAVQNEQTQKKTRVCVGITRVFIYAISIRDYFTSSKSTSVTPAVAFVRERCLRLEHYRAFEAPACCWPWGRCRGLEQPDCKSGIQLGHGTVDGWQCLGPCEPLSVC